MLERTRTPRQRAEYLVVDKQGRHVDVRAQARLDGKAQMPPTDATEVNDTEQAIIGQFEGEHLNAVEEAQSDITARAAAADDLYSHLPQPAALDGIVDDSRTQIEHALLGNVELHRLLENYQAQRAARLHFPREHGLFREPHYPLSRWAHFSPLALVFLLETLLNGFFFAEHDALGLFGGMTRAVLISGVNVASGVLVGMLVLPYVHHVRPMLRTRAWVGMGVFTAGALTFNVVAAAFRDAYAAGGGVTNASTIGLLLGAGRLSFQSALMCSAGLVTCALAVHKGYASDDRYPGYGAIDRQYVDTRLALDAAAEASKRDLLARNAAVTPACDALVDRAEALLAQLGEGLANARRSTDSCDAERERLDDRTRIHLSAYRGENKLYRHTPPPAYFDSFPTLHDLLDRQPLWRMQQQLASARRIVDELKTRAAAIKADGPARAAAIAHRFHEFITHGSWIPAPAETSAPIELRWKTDGEGA